MPQLNRPPARGRQHGFTLVELAVTLLVVTILSAMLLVPITGREGVRARQETEHLLDEIREALIGYAIIHGHLPCPSRQANPAASDYGTADTTCTGSAEGYLPWRTLGLTPVDAWGVTRQSATDPWLGYWRYRVVPSLSNAAFPIQAATLPDLDLNVRDVVTGQVMTDTKMLAAVVFSTGPDRTPNADNASYETGDPATYALGGPTTSFDDMLVWVSHPQLIARMAAAGQL